MSQGGRRGKKELLNFLKDETDSDGKLRLSFRNNKALGYISVPRRERRHFSPSRPLSAKGSFQFVSYLFNADSQFLGQKALDFLVSEPSLISFVVGPYVSPAFRLQMVRSINLYTTSLTWGERDRKEINNLKQDKAICTKHRSRKGHKLQNTESSERAISRKLENEKRRMPRFERRYGVLLVLNVIYDRLICYKQRMTTLKRAVISPSICFRGECSFKMVLVQRAQGGKRP